jgi:translation elongation factor EF-4
MPDPSIIQHIEPFITAQIITAADYVGRLWRFCMEKRELSARFTFRQRG